MTVKFLDRNSPSGTRGCFDLAIRTGNNTAATAPTTSDTYGSAPFQFSCCPMMAPKERPPTARKMTAAPSQSKCPVASSSRDSCTWTTQA